MFPSHVLAASGTVVDLNRASVLMDKELLQQSIYAMERERTTRPRPDATYDAQWVWDHYCQRHVEKYGKHFIPDVKPDWDFGSTSSEFDKNPARDAEPSQPECDDRVNAITVLTADRMPAVLARLRDQARRRQARKP